MYYAYLAAQPEQDPSGSKCCCIDDDEVCAVENCHPIVTNRTSVNGIIIQYAPMIKCRPYHKNRATHNIVNL